jgi:hypothetical protein
MAVIASIAITAGVAAYQSYEAHKATDAQKKAVTDAQGIQEKQWAQTQANLAPQLEMGRNAMSSLNVAMGMGGGGTSPVVNQPQAVQYGGARPPRTAPKYGDMPDRASDNLQPLSAINAPQVGYVTMRAPDGSRARVPASAVKTFQAKGAVVEGGGAGPTTQTGSVYRPSQQAF